MGAVLVGKKHEIGHEVAAGDFFEGEGEVGWDRGRGRSALELLGQGDILLDGRWLGSGS